MIVSVATFSREHAAALVERGFPAEHSFAALRRAWVGFEASSADLSPLHHVYVGASLVERCEDWDEDDRHAELAARGWGCLCGPSPAIAARLVAFVRDIHRAEDDYALCVHCVRGRYRSGAVVEWCRNDLAIPEHPESQRLLPDDEDGFEGGRTANAALLRMIRAAARP